MAKLSKIMYTTAKGERKINSYLATIPKSVLQKSRITDNDEIIAYEELGNIVISLKYHCTCMECSYEWDSGEEYKLWTSCPKCHCGDISYEINGEDYDN